jgi:hypothetical protein
VFLHLRTTVNGLISNNRTFVYPCPSSILGIEIPLNAPQNQLPSGFRQYLLVLCIAILRRKFRHNHLKTTLLQVPSHRSFSFFLSFLTFRARNNGRSRERSSRLCRHRLPLPLGHLQFVFSDFLTVHICILTNGDLNFYLGSESGERSPADTLGFRPKNITQDMVCIAPPP